MSSVFAADYTVTIHNDNVDISADDLKAKVNAFYAQPEIITEKETKKSTRTLDLKPLIYYLCCENKVIKMCLSTGSTDNIKPELVMAKFCEFIGMEYTEEPILFDYARNEIYTNAGDDNEVKLVTLENMGENIEG